MLLLQKKWFDVYQIYRCIKLLHDNDVFHSKHKCGACVMLSKYPSHGGYFLGYLAYFMSYTPKYPTYTGWFMIFC